MEAIVIIIIGLVIMTPLLIWWTWDYYKREQEKREQRLLLKYRDLNVVRAIIAKEVWVGQTQEQLYESLGRPLDIDQKVLKTKVKETWKYHQVGKNRYGLKVTLDNGIVVGWDKKD